MLAYANAVLRADRKPARAGTLRVCVRARVCGTCLIEDDRLTGHSLCKCVLPCIIIIYVRVAVNKYDINTN